jgi:hypothetical protein
LKINKKKGKKESEHLNGVCYLTYNHSWDRRELLLGKVVPFLGEVHENRTILVDKQRLVP